MVLHKILYWTGMVIRDTANSLDKLGCLLQGKYAFREQLSRHRRLMNFDYNIPKIGEKAWIAPNAAVIGKVEIGEGSSVWYGAVLRGDVNYIKIGNQSSIGDRCVIHVSSGHPKGALPTIVGSNVVIGQGSILHACTVEDGAQIEAGSIILDGVVIGKNSIITSGSLVSMGKIVPPGEVWSGNPAKFVRKITNEEEEKITTNAQIYFELAQKHDFELSLTEQDRYIRGFVAENFVIHEGVYNKK